MDKLFSIGEAAEALGVSTQTLRRWDREDRFKPDARTRGGQRRYTSTQLSSEHGSTQTTLKKKTIDKEEIEKYCTDQGFDAGTFATYDAKRDRDELQSLLSKIISNKLNKLVFADEAHYAFFAEDIVRAICTAKNIDIILIDE